MTQQIRFRLVAGLAVLAVAVGSFVILNRPESAALKQSTDDAYTRADFVVVVPQVSGAITRVAVVENQAVKAGDSLVSIDDREFRIAVDNAKADVAGARATIAGLQQQVGRQESLVAQARATLAAAEAQLKLADSDRKRYANLAREGSGTVQAQQQAQAQWEVRRAARERERAVLQAAEQQTAILHAELDKAQAALEAAQSRQAAAELNLSRTNVSAEVEGVIAQLRARQGGYARIGESLLTLVPLDALYVEANFRETQLARVRPGQRVELTVDALPGVQLEGRVESLGPASGVSYSPVPPHNATGNFTKIVQRLPVRISLTQGQAALQKLRVGMSVRPHILTDDQSIPSTTDRRAVTPSS